MGVKDLELTLPSKRSRCIQKPSIKYLQQKDARMPPLSKRDQLNIIKKMDIAIFLKKFYTVLLTEPESVVGWTQDGEGVEVRDMETFENDILPKHFQYASLSTFLRQLNCFGFKRRGALYSRRHFLRDEPGRMFLIQRRGTRNVQRAVFPKRRIVFMTSPFEKQPGF